MAKATQVSRPPTRRGGVKHKATARSACLHNNDNLLQTVIRRHKSPATPYLLATKTKTHKKQRASPHSSTVDRSTSSNNFLLLRRRTVYKIKRLNQQDVSVGVALLPPASAPSNVAHLTRRLALLSSSCAPPLSPEPWCSSLRTPPSTQTIETPILSCLFSREDVLWYPYRARFRSKTHAHTNAYTLQR